MLNKKLNLHPELFLDKPKMAATRDGFGEGVVEAGKQDERVVVLTADLKDSTRVGAFAAQFPDRFIEVGVAEQGMVTVASGMANYGKIPFCSSYSVFSPGRNWEQIRTTVCINDVAVKIIGSHAGINVGADGATHQALEDIALTRSLPNMIVFSPCDSKQAQKATLEASRNNKPTYIRLTRDKFPIVTSSDTLFEPGKAQLLWESEDPEVVFVTTGSMVYNTLLAAKSLSEEGVDTNVLNIHTIKPIDEEAIISQAQKTAAVVSVEEHQITGGLGSAVAEVLVKNHPTLQEFVGVPDRFGQSATPEELFNEYGLNVESIKEAARRLISRKS